MDLKRIVNSVSYDVPYVTLPNGSNMPMIGLGTWRVCMIMCMGIYNVSELTVKSQNIATSECRIVFILSKVTENKTK